MKNWILTKGIALSVFILVSCGCSGKNQVDSTLSQVQLTTQFPTETVQIPWMLMANTKVSCLALIVKALKLKFY